MAATVPPSEGVVTRPSPRSVTETVDRLQQIIDTKGLVLFGLVDHSGEAQRAGLEMPDTKLVIFGSPATGTPVMLASPMVALDLPLKILISADAGGDVSVSYNSPDYLAARHHLTDDLRKPLAGVEAIAEALVAP